MGFKTSGPALSSSASTASGSSTTELKATAVSTTSPTATLSTTSALSRSAAGLNIAFFETIVEITLPELLLRVPWIDRQSKTSSLHDCKLAVGVVYVQSEPLAGETAPDESGKSEMLNDNHFDLMRGN